MFDHILTKIRDKILKKKYVMTLHAEEEMNDDGLSIYDVEEIISSGTIKERQKDQRTAEWKYCIQGKTMSSHVGEVVVKLGLTGKVILITVYKD